MNTRISKNINHLRQINNYTKLWVGEQIGKNNSTISNYEAGRVIPPIVVLQQIADLFEVNIGDIVSRDLWLGEGGESFNAPRDKRLEREKSALHDLLDEKEQRDAEIRKELAHLIKEMKASGSESPYFGKIQELRKLLDQ